MVAMADMAALARLLGHTTPCCNGGNAVRHEGCAIEWPRATTVERYRAGTMARSAHATRCECQPSKAVAFALAPVCVYRGVRRHVQAHTHTHAHSRLWRCTIGESTAVASTQRVVFRIVLPSWSGNLLFCLIHAILLFQNIQPRATQYAAHSRTLQQDTAQHRQGLQTVQEHTWAPHNPDAVCKPV